MQLPRYPASSSDSTRCGNYLHVTDPDRSRLGAASVGHSKDSCVEIDESCNGGDSVPVAESGPSGSKMDSTVIRDKTDSFGPWMQVSYGRNGRNVGSLNMGGKNSDIVGVIGKSSGMAKVGSGFPSYGGEISRKTMSNRRVAGKVHAVVNGRKIVHPTKNRNLGNNLSGGSRFAVLSNIAGDDPSTKQVPSKVIDKGKCVSSSVLSEISNRVPPRKKFISPPPKNKYLSASGSNKCQGSSLLKENLCSEGSIVCQDNSSSLVEDLEDSDVLRSLHANVMDSVMASSEPSSSIVGGGIGDSSGNPDLVCGSGLQVDVSAAVVASDLREAMEVALE
ncbi:hypothetical protein Q3G72_034873 [Acer saccharum]|nr:hypothetical protein Q3G72_034873 [Acer saccharum]